MLQNLYSNIILKFPKLFLSFVFIIVALLSIGITKFEIDFSSETLLLKNDKDLEFSREVNKRYYTPDYLVVTYKPNSKLLAKDTLETISNLTKEFKSIDDVTEVTSILSVPLLQSSDKSLSELIDDIPTLESISNKNLAKKEFLNSALYKNNLVSNDFKTTAMLIYFKEDKKYFELLNRRNSLEKDSLELKEANKIFKEYRDNLRDKNHQNIVQVREILTNHSNTGKLFLGGINMITDDMISFIKYDLKTYGVVVLLVLISILWIIFRQVRYILIPVIISSLSVISTAGLLGLFGWEVTIISSNFISIQLIITMSLSIHLIVRYRELLQLYPNLSQKELVLKTTIAMSKPSFFVILTTIIGFGSLVVSGILPVINLGLMMSAGIFMSLIITFLVFPTIMANLKKIPSHTSFESSFALTKKLASIVKDYPKKVIAIAIISILFGVYGITKLIVENSFIDYFKKDTAIYKGMETIDRSLGGTTTLDIVLNFDNNEVEIVEIKDSKEVDEFDDFENEFAEDENDAKYWFTSQKMQIIEKIHDYLDSRDEIGKVLSLATILKIGRELNEGKNLDNFALALLYEKLPEIYKKIILYPYLSIEDNQVRFSVRIIDSKEGLRRDEMLKSIQTDLKDNFSLKNDDFKLTGMMVLYNNMLQSLFDSQIKTLGIVVLILSLVFLIIFKSIKVGIIAMIVNVIPITMILGIMGITKIPLDIMTITIAAISISMAVDNTIHYLHRFKLEMKTDSDYLSVMFKSHNTIGYAMYYTSFAIMMGFSILMLSNFMPTIYFGLLTALAMFLALIGDLILLPSLIIIFKPFGRK